MTANKFLSSLISEEEKGNLTPDRVEEEIVFYEEEVADAKNKLPRLAIFQIDEFKNAQEKFVSDIAEGLEFLHALNAKFAE